MMTEEAKIEQKKKTIENGIRLCEEGMAKAEKYERLSDNKDWQGFLNDLRVLSDLHDKEIKMGEAMLIDAPSNGYIKLDGFDKQQYVSSREDWVEFIIRHQIQKAECANWVKEPERIITFAKLCRDRLPVLKGQLKEISDGPIEAKS